MKLGIGITLTISIAVGTAVAQTLPPTPPPAQASDPCAGTVVIGSTPQWLQVLPARQPPTTSRLSFDAKDGRHAEATWDPYDGRGLARSVLLTEGTWQISFWAEPQRDSMKFANNYAWQARAAACTADWKRAPSVILEERRGDDLPSYVTVELSSQARPGLVSVMAGTATTPADLGSALRALGANDVPAQAAEAVTQVVTRAIKRRVVRLAQRKALDIVCGAEAATSPRLPRTCRALTGIELTGLSAAARPLAAAVTLDLLDRVVPAELPPGVRDALTVGVELAYHRVDATPEDARLLLLQAAGAYLRSDMKDAGVLAAQVIMKLLAHCVESSPCDASTIRAVLTEPWEYFNLDSLERRIRDRYAAMITKHIASLEQAVTSGRRIVDQARSISSAERVRAALRSQLQLVSIVACFADDRACHRLGALREIADHASRGDLIALLRSAASLGQVELSERALRRLGLLLTVVQQAAAAHGGSPEERKLAIGQIDAALDSYLDSAAERPGREGDWIFSVGVGVRAHAAVKLTGSWFRGPASVPVALSVDRLCAPDAPRWWCQLDGLHVEVGILDVGNYLRIRDDGADSVDAEPVDWTDVANLSIGAGYLFGSPDLPFYFGATAGLAPGARGAGEERDWNLYVGAFGGAYLPLIDFN